MSEKIYRHRTSVTWYAKVVTPFAGSDDTPHFVIEEGGLEGGEFKGDGHYVTLRATRFTELYTPYEVELQEGLYFAHHDDHGHTVFLVNRQFNSSKPIVWRLNAEPTHMGSFDRWAEEGYRNFRKATNINGGKLEVN